MIAFIIGITGQDGAHLADLLLKKGYEVYGGYRHGGMNRMWRTDFLGITSQIKLVKFHLDEPQHIVGILKKIQPDEIYNLAGESFVADSFGYPSKTMDINTNGVINILESAKLVSPNSKIFFASSSEIFGHADKDNKLSEISKTMPNNPYAISKLAANHFVKLYRDKYDLFACSGILFNHEGVLRSRHFVTRKITYNMAQMIKDREHVCELGSFDSERDWGAAIDYVDAMNTMLVSDKPNDYVVATGRLTSIREILTMAANFANFDPVFEGSGKDEVCVNNSDGRVLARLSNKHYRKFDTAPMVGDASLIKAETGWCPRTSVKDMIESMVKADIHRRKQGILDI